MSWRTRATIAKVAEVIAALAAAVRELALRGQSLRQRSRIGWQIIEYPVNKGPAGCIRVGNDQGKARRSGGGRGPGELRRDPSSVTSELRWNLAPLKAATGQIHFHRHSLRR
jgi:hypothetical protein